MGRRLAFRPSLSEVLEERVVMNGGGWSKHHWQPRPAPMPPAVMVPAQMALGPVGTLGDSYTDDYRYYPPDRVVARNWLEILAATRGVNFGPFSHVSLSEPRNQGNVNNWARSDATTTQMVANQLPGLADQVARGQVKDVTILVGGNDFLEVLYGAAAGVISTQDAIGLMPLVAQRASLNFNTAVNTLLAASPDVRIVAATINVNLPIVLAGVGSLPDGQALLAATQGSVNSYNGVISQLAAASPRVGLADLAALSLPPSAIGTGFPFGGTTITYSVGNDFRNLYLADGIHLGTVGQGLIANAFLAAFNREFGVRVKPLSETEIVNFARTAQHTPPPRSVIAMIHAMPRPMRMIPRR